MLQLNLLIQPASPLIWSQRNSTEASLWMTNEEGERPALPGRWVNNGLALRY